MKKSSKLRTPADRGRSAIVIEFDTPVLERLRLDAKADQRSVGYLVRQIIGLHYAEIDAGRGEQYRQDPTDPSGWKLHRPLSAGPLVMKKFDEAAEFEVPKSDSQKNQ